MPPMGKKELTQGVARWTIRELFGVTFVALALFWPAGRLNWAWGWALVGLYFCWFLITAIVMIPRNPELLIERATRRKGVKRWDVTLMSVIGLSTIAKLVLAGLDLRYGWTAVDISAFIRTAALVLSTGGYLMVIWSMLANAYFSQIVRIQEDRGHAIASGGPYRFVRHPGYLGTIVFEIFTPLMLGSLWALIPAIISAIMFGVRTALEDRTLQMELAGYKAYAQRVCYRLLPGVW